jgi:biofilm PGA synthesis lipoprotein PgaB
MWPYGGYTQVSDTIAASLGMPVSFTLGLPVTFPDRPFGTIGLQAIPRLVLMSNPAAENLAWSIQHPILKGDIRAVQVDLDYIYDPDPDQQERNLSALLERIKTLNVTQVWLQAFADPSGSNVAAQVYFPNSHLPMRADLFSRVAWQLRTRCGVSVYAWLPVLAWQLPDTAIQARLQIAPKAGVKAESPARLNPFLPQSRSVIGDLYEDLARNAPIAGVLFNDDAVLRDTDDLGALAPKPGPARTRALIEFTNELKVRVQRWRPEIATARNLFAEPILHPQSESWYAQSLPAFLTAYNEVALMAMPAMENNSKPNPWLGKLATQVGSVPGGFNRTVFELQTVDWRTKKPIATRELVRQMQLLQSKGVLHLAYYPDDAEKSNPDIPKLIPTFSASNFPATQP